MQQIKPDIYYEVAHLGVTLGALVKSHGTIIIDAPLRPEDARSWRSALLNQRGGTSRLLILLDSHPDRTLGARALESTILAHDNTAQAFSNRSLIFKGQIDESGADWEGYHDAIGIRWAPPDVTFSQQMTLHWGGPEIILEHHPGPAPGAIWVYVPEEKVIFIGDAVITDQPPFLANADLETWIEDLTTLSKSYKDYLIVGGRNGLLTIEDVRAQNNFLKKVVKRLERLAQKNAPPEATDKLVPSLLSSFSFRQSLTERYTQRLKTGLYRYYHQHYLTPNNLSLEDTDPVD
jgi:glyoxylase-like metal-dependent hydrolase (beta-lactamase superfamily II)